MNWHYEDEAVSMVRTLVIVAIGVVVMLVMASDRASSLKNPRTQWETSKHDEIRWGFLHAPERFRSITAGVTVHQPRFQP